MNDLARNEESGMKKKSFIIRNNALHGGEEIAGHFPKGLRIKIEKIRKVISGKMR
jgi:hypothetical protein